MLDYQCFLKIFYNLSKLLIIRNLTLQTFNFMTFYTELIYDNLLKKIQYAKIFRFYCFF